MLTGKPLLRPAIGVQSPGIPSNTMIASKNKNGISKIFLFLSGFKKLLVTKISIPECIQLINIFKAIFMNGIIRKICLFKLCKVFSRNSIRTMIIGGLYDGKKKDVVVWPACCWPPKANSYHRCPKRLFF